MLLSADKTAEARTVRKSTEAETAAPTPVPEGAEPMTGEDGLRVTTIQYTIGGTVADGSRCVFPFQYEGHTYIHCTEVEHVQPWCSTTASYSGSWGNCVKVAFLDQDNDGKPDDLAYDPSRILGMASGLKEARDSSWAYTAEALAAGLLIMMVFAAALWLQAEGGIAGAKTCLFGTTEQMQERLDMQRTTIGHALLERPEGAVGTTTTNGMATNLITIMVGAGVLAFSDACAICGWILGPCLLMSAFMLNTWLSLMVCRILVKLREEGQKVDSLHELTKTLVGPRAAKYMDLFLCFLIFSCGCCFVVLTAENLNYIFPWARRPWACVAGFLLCFTAMLRDMSVIAKLAVIGIIASVAYVVCIGGSSIMAAQTYPENSRYHSLYPPKQNIAGWMAVLRSFNMISFGFGIQVYLPGYMADMQKPEELGHAVVRGSIAATFIFVLCMLFGYWGFGNLVNGNILQSMCDAVPIPHDALTAFGTPYKSMCDLGGRKMVFGTILASAVIANLAVTIPLLNYLLFQVIETGSKALQDSRAKSNMMRIGCIIIMTLFGVGVPFFNEMLGLVSAIVVVAANMVVPCFFQIVVNRREGKPQSASVPQYITLVLACILSITGLIASMQRLQNKVAANPEELDPIGSFWK